LCLGGGDRKSPRRHSRRRRYRCQGTDVARAIKR
jgi:hypothetical protein